MSYHSCRVINYAQVDIFLFILHIMINNIYRRKYVRFEIINICSDTTTMLKYYVFRYIFQQLIFQKYIFNYYTFNRNQQSILSLVHEYIKCNIFIVILGVKSLLYSKSRKTMVIRKTFWCYQRSYKLWSNRQWFGRR